MGFSTANINKVRAMVFPAGMLSNGVVVWLPGAVLVSWHSSETDKLFQVYVDGQLAGATLHVQQRMLLVRYAHTHTAAIEVVAVEAEGRDVDYSEQLVGFTDADGSHAVLSWPKRGSLPLDSKANIYWNCGSGEVDYNEPLAIQNIWSGLAEKWGWGLDTFGNGDFGYSGTGAVGFGCGSFGLGELGFDAQMGRFQSGSLMVGTYKFAVRISDGLDNLDDGGVDILTVSVDPLPAAASVSIDSYDKQSDELVLNIS